MTDAVEAFRKDTEEQLCVARHMLEDSHLERIDRMAVFRDGSQQLNVVMIPDIPNDKLPLTIKHFVEMFGADRVYIIAEAWKTVVSIGTPFLAPSESEHRKEVILVYALDRDTHSALCLTQTIERHSDGKPYFPQSPEMMSMEADQGRFGQLLDILWSPDPTSQLNSERLN